jgi:hypothetical protein
MSELLQGPVPKYENTPEAINQIESLIASKHDLYNAYGEVYREGFFVKEFGGKDKSHSIAAVGDMDTLAEWEFRTGKEIDAQELSLGDCIFFSAYPGNGSTRAESVRDGLRQALKARNDKLEQR